MKKILAIALALVLVCSMGMVALANEPDGSETAPFAPNSPLEITGFVTVPAGTTVWYNLNSRAFNGMNLTASAGLTSITVDGMAFYPSPALRGGIEAALNARNVSMMVGLVNDGTDDVRVYLEVSAPVGSSMANPESLYDGMEAMFMFDGTSMDPYWYAFSTDNLGGTLKVTVEADCADYVVAVFDTYTEDIGAFSAMIEPDMDTYVGTYEVEMDNYSTMYFGVAPNDMVAGVIKVELELPPVGSEANPISIWEESSLEELVIPAGETVYVAMEGFNGTTLYVDHEIDAQVVGAEEAIDGCVVLENYITVIKLTNNGDADYVYPMWVEYSMGTEQNPENIADGETKLETDAFTYFYTYYALNDGVVTVSVSDIKLLDDLLVRNNTVLDDPDYDWADADKYMDSAYEYKQLDDEGYVVYDENGYPVYAENPVFTITVNKGDEVMIALYSNYIDPLAQTLTVEGPEAPLGTFDNPDTFEAGKNEFTVSAEDMMYAGTWTAPADGTITITVTGEVTDFLMGHIETDDPLIMSEGDKLVLDVKKGDEIAFVAVAGVDETTGDLVDTDVVLEIDFVEEKTDSPATGAAGAGVAVLLTLISGAGLAVLNKKRG